MTQEKSLLAKKFAVAIGIAIIFPMLMHYGARTISPPPHWRDYAVPHFSEKYETLSPEERKKLETKQNQLEEERRVKQSQFQKVLFVVVVPAGLVAIIAGSLISIQAIGSGLMFGGIFCLIDGFINYWDELPDFMRFLSLLAGFGVLLFVGFRKLKTN